MDSRPRTLVIINHAAARARRAWATIESALKARGLHFDAHETRHAGDATDTTRAALRAGYQLIAAVGGDGTLSETAAGFFNLDERPAKIDGPQRNEEPGFHPAPVSADAALAILPAGTGDDFARGLTGGREPVAQWLEKLVRYYEQPETSSAHGVDLIYGSTEAFASHFICLNVVTLGIGAEVAGRVAAQSGLMRHLPGEARFTAAACGALVAWRERRVRVTVDDRPPLECSSNLLAVANGIYAGGGMMFAPDARLDDGLMDLLLGQDLSRANILRELPRIRRGAHLSNPHVRQLRCRRVRIETLDRDDALPVEADGNVRGHTPVEFRIMPAALRLVTGEHWSAQRLD